MRDMREAGVGIANPESTRPPIVDEMISHVNPLVAQTAAELRGLTNGAGIKPSDLNLYRLLLDRRVADLRERAASVNFKTGIFEGEILGSASQEGESQTSPKTWPVLMVAGTLGGELPSLPNVHSSQITLEALIAEHMGDHSFVSFAVLTDDVQPRRYAFGSFLTVPVTTVNSGRSNETPYRIRLH